MTKLTRWAATQASGAVCPTIHWFRWYYYVNPLAMKSRMFVQLVRVPRIVIAAITLLCGLSSVSAAQRGGRSRDGTGGALGEPAPTLQASDVVRLDPIAMLLDRRGELGLVDSQITRLSAISAELRARNAAGLKSLDSLLRDIRMHVRDTTGTDGDRLMRQGDQQRAFAVLLGTIRDNDDAAAGRAMGLFSGRQLRQAFAVVQEQRTLMRAVVRGGTVPDLGTPSRGVY